MKFEKCEKEIQRDWGKFFYETEEELKNPTESFYNDKERNHLIIALAKNRNMWKWIDKAYELKKHEYYKAYKDSFFYDTPLKEVFSLHTKEYINKLAGIVYWCKENGTEEPIVKIIQKEYKKIYSEFKIATDSLDLDRFIARKLKNVKKQTGDSAETILEQNNNLEETITVALFLGKIYGIEVDGFLWKKLYSGFISNTFTGIGVYLSSRRMVSNCKKDELVNLIENVLETKYKTIKKCKNLYDLLNLLIIEQSNLSRKATSIMNVASNELTSLHSIHKKVLDMVVKDGKATMTENLLDKIIDDNSAQLLENTPIREFGTMISYFFGLPKISGLEKEVFLDVPVNMEIIEVAVVYSMEDNLDKYLSKQKKVTNNIRFNVLASITILSLFEYFKNLKLTTVDQEEAMVVEIENLNSKLQDKDKEIAMLKEKIEQLNRVRKSEVEDVLSELELTKKNVKRLKNELQESKKNEVEFIALKEYAYRNSLSEEELALTFDNELTIEEKIQYLNTKKIAVFGGHPNWVNKLKKLLPDAKYVDTNAFSSRKFNRLDKYDLLVICNLFMCHSLSWKIGEAIKNVKSKKVIIIDDINTNLIINNLYAAVKEYETACE